MHSLVKEQKKSTFTVPFLGPGGAKNETAESQNPQQRPTRATNKKIKVHLFKQPAYRVGTEEAPHMRSLIRIDFPAPEMEPESAHVVSAVSVP